MSGFVSVSTSAARFQDISLNPQNLAGQCAKLKCCINFEVNTYVEAIRQLPAKDVHLETKDNTYYFFKADALKREITYSTERNAPVNTVTLTAAQAFEVIALNKNGVKPDALVDDDGGGAKASPFGDLLNQDAINRFDKKKKKKKKKGGDRQQQGSRQDKAGRQDKADSQDKQQRPDSKEANGRPDRGDRKQRAAKQRKPRTDGSRVAAPNGEHAPDKPQRVEKNTFRPRQPKDSTAPNGGNQGSPSPDAR